MACFQVSWRVDASSAEADLHVSLGEWSQPTGGDLTLFRGDVVDAGLRVDWMIIKSTSMTPIISCGRSMNGGIPGGWRI